MTPISIWLKLFGVAIAAILAGVFAWGGMRAAPLDLQLIAAGTAGTLVLVVGGLILIAHHLGKQESSKNSRGVSREEFVELRALLTGTGAGSVDSAITAKIDALQNGAGMLGKLEHDIHTFFGGQQPELTLPQLIALTVPDMAAAKAQIEELEQQTRARLEYAAQNEQIWRFMVLWQLETAINDAYPVKGRDGKNLPPMLARTNVDKRANDFGPFKQMTTAAELYEAAGNTWVAEPLTLESAVTEYHRRVQAGEIQPLAATAPAPEGDDSPTMPGVRRQPPAPAARPMTDRTVIAPRPALPRPPALTVGRGVRPEAQTPG